MPRTATFSAAAILIISARLLAQGGVPMITDDANTLEKGHWEDNIATLIDHTESQTFTSLPLLDFNYGLTNHIQLNYQLPHVLADLPEHGIRGGFGDSRFGLKWQFIEEKKAGFAMSTFPHTDVPTPIGHASHHDVVLPGSQLFLPIEISKNWNRFGLASEIGYNIVETGDNTLQWGLVAQYTLNKHFDVSFEVRTAVDTADWTDETLLNFGLRWHLNDTVHLLGAVGHTIREFPEEDPRLLIYTGIQFTF